MNINLRRPASSVVWFVWHCLATVAIVLIPNQLCSGALWKLEASCRPFFVEMAITYWASVIALTVYTRKDRRIRFIDLASIVLPIFGIFFLFLLLSRSEYSRLVLIVSLVLVAAFSVLPLSLKTSFQKPGLAIASALVVLIPLAGFAGRTPSSEIVVQNRVIRTSFYNLVARYFLNFVVEEVTGGAISKFGDRYLLATGDGQLHTLFWDRKKKSWRPENSRSAFHSTGMNSCVISPAINM
jgi:Flp pilus assembly pilin Flp